MTFKNVKRKFFHWVNSRSNPEILVRDVTSKDPSMPTDEAMAEVAKLTFDKLGIFVVIKIIVNRIEDRQCYPHVLKATKLLLYLLENGSNTVVKLCIDSYYNRLQRAFEFKFNNWMLEVNSARSHRRIEKNSYRNLEFWRNNILKNCQMKKT
jgi:epsin